MSLKKLIVDANAFIKGYPLEELSPLVYTIPDVMKELRDAATRKKLEFTPYELILEEPSIENIKAATDFSKKTGDYASLSLVDIKLIALAIKIHESDISPVEFKTSEIKTVFGSGGGGTTNNKSNENDNNTNTCSDSSLPIGFHMPHIDLKKYNEHFKNFSYTKGYNFSENDTKLYQRLDGINIGDHFVYLKRWKSHIECLVKFPSVADMLIENDVQIKFETKLKISKENEESGSNESEEEEEEENKISDGEEEEEEDDENDSDDGGWITSSNYKPRVQTTTNSSIGVLTTDFALQNVLLHTNIPLISPYGHKITTLRSYILRCYACFEKTTQFDRQFCSRCGNKTLKKVSVSVQEDGNMKLHFSKRFVITRRGKKFSLPSPKGGKYAVNPILTQDQHVTYIKRSKKAVAKEIGPFSMNDVNTRSFMVQGQTSHYWDTKNPNEVRRGNGQKKQKN